MKSLNCWHTDQCLSFGYHKVDLIGESLNVYTCTFIDTAADQ